MTEEITTSDGVPAFDQMVGQLDHPMFIVTTGAWDRPVGCLVGFATQASIDPPRFLVGLSPKNHTYAAAARATHLAVHVLPRARWDLARLFGGTSGDDTNKFGRCDWHAGPAGVPILDDAAAWFVGAVLSRIDLGDHVGHLLRPIAGGGPATRGALVMSSDVRDLTPGHRA